MLSYAVYNSQWFTTGHGSEAVKMSCYSSRSRILSFGLDSCWRLSPADPAKIDFLVSQAGKSGIQVCAVSDRDWYVLTFQCWWAIWLEWSQSITCGPPRENMFGRDKGLGCLLIHRKIISIGMNLWCPGQGLDHCFLVTDNDLHVDLQHLSST